MRNSLLHLTVWIMAMLPSMLVAQNWQSAVTMDGEPHHHLAFNNQYVRVFKVEVAPHSATLLHQHHHDYIFVTFGDTSIESDVEGKPPTKLELKDGDVRFTKGGFAHVAKNLSARPFRNVTVEFLQPVGDLKQPQTADQPGLGTGCQFGGVMFPATIKVLYSSDVVRVRDYTLPRKCGVSPEAKGALIVALSPIVISHSSGAPTPLKRGDLTWLTSRDTIVNRHPAGVRFITIEFEK